MDTNIPTQTRMKEDSFMIDLSLDYHAHILPGCDHGSSSVAMSLKQIDMAKAAGIKTICATPHFYPHKESVSSLSQDGIKLLTAYGHRFQKMHPAFC